MSAPTPIGTPTPLFPVPCRDLMVPPPHCSLHHPHKYMGSSHPTAPRIPRVPQPLLLPPLTPTPAEPCRMEGQMGRG